MATSISSPAIQFLMGRFTLNVLNAAKRLSVATQESIPCLRRGFLSSNLKHSSRFFTHLSSKSKSVGYQEGIVCSAAEKESRYLRMGTIANGAKYECLLFDLDDTLYPSSSSLNLACCNIDQDYMLHHLNIEESKASQMYLDLSKEYGTTMAGLKALGFEFDDDIYRAYVRGRFPYEMLKPDPILKNLLHSMPQRKIIFTNADSDHAVVVLSRLGLEDCFEGIICFETLNPSTDHNNEDDRENGSLTDNPTDHVFSSGSESENDETKVRILCKPSVKAMNAAIKIANVDPRKSIFFDDSARNIAAGKAAGLNTVIVGSSVLVPGADIALESIHNIKEAIPAIWQNEDQPDQSLVNAVETIVHT